MGLAALISVFVIMGPLFDNALGNTNFFGASTAIGTDEEYDARITEILSNYPYATLFSEVYTPEVTLDIGEETFTFTQEFVGAQNVIQYEGETYALDERSGFVLDKKRYLEFYEKIIFDGIEEPVYLIYDLTYRTSCSEITDQPLFARPNFVCCGGQEVVELPTCPGSLTLACGDREIYCDGEILKSVLVTGDVQ